MLNAILKRAHPIVDVEILNPFSYQEFADEKLVVLDIRARDSAGRWLNIEMQVTVPAVEFQQAISVIEAISAKTEDRMMHDQRLKAQRDYQWGLDSARQEGMEKGEAVGKIQLLQELLGDELTCTTSLRKLTIGDLSTMLADLQQRLRSRES